MTVFPVAGLLAQVWQWSVPLPAVISPETNHPPRAFLWIPENCGYVRAVVVGQHNMLEEGIFEHPEFRKTMKKLGFAVVWISPHLDVTFDFHHGAAEHFQEMMGQLAEVSGYQELGFAPIVPVGHSALASFPWNFAAWNPERTLAAISIHGDAPQTHLTGSGRPNPSWTRHIDGVPGLMVMGEYEWMEERLSPAFAYVARHPATPFSLLADAGRGHFDYSDQLVRFLDLYLEKAARYRLPERNVRHGPVRLRPVDVTKGWLVDRWRKDARPQASPAPYASYGGDRQSATWCFDKEMAMATEVVYGKSRGKKRQYLGFQQEGKWLEPTNTHANFHLRFLPQADGITFTVRAALADSSRVRPAGAWGRGRVAINRICGPVRKLNDSTFQIQFYRMGFDNPKRSNDIWLLASGEGDNTWKSIVQQADLRFPLTNTEGRQQRIDFPSIGDQRAGTPSLPLTATTDGPLPVSYYVREGPAIVQGSRLVFTRLPPRSRLPVRVTVVAWQYGTRVGDKVQSAAPVERQFFLRKQAKACFLFSSNP